MSKRRLPIDPKQWLNHLQTLRGEESIAVVQVAIGWYDAAHLILLEKGLSIADILLSLGLDNEALGAAIAYPALQAQEISFDMITDTLGVSSSQLLNDVLQMQSLGKLQHIEQNHPHQVENLRKMLLAMVKDVRAVILALAERLWQLRQAKELPPDEQKTLARETFTVYAPLANRLGIWQLKWEIEDLCLRYSHPETYKQIAAGIARRRDDRESYIERFIAELTQILQQAGIKSFEVSGRVKHIYSIYKKMQRKAANLEQIYDMTALRVLTHSIEDCYAVLGILQNHWQQIPEEFDDYITHPKPNGYRSIHTVVIGPENHAVEIQIRTEEMHQESELGVAAHWRYKEGVLQTSHYEAKIALLRQILAWQKEVVRSDTQDRRQATQDLFADRIYVFTPTGDIIDLPKGATPLDFAYHIHSEVGHRCRGAKIDGNIVPLTYSLQLGERVEILTAKYANPSRDWLSPQLGFLKTARARAKLQHWFKVKDSLRVEEEKLKKETKELPKVEFAKPLPILNPAIEGGIKERDSRSHVEILGIDNLLTHVALCCKPLPGDAIIGYVSRQRGVSIHRRDCRNLMQMTREDNVKRLMEVDWSQENAGNYAADLLLHVQDRPGLLRDIASFLASLKINVVGIKTEKLQDLPEMTIYLTIEIENKQQLKMVLEQLKKIPHVMEAKRR